jgi:hypothetical protein
MGPVLQTGATQMPTVASLPNKKTPQFLAAGF